MKRTTLLSLILACGLMGCFSVAARPAVVTSADGPIFHVVIAWLKEPGNAEARARILEACEELEKIPGVRSVDGGVVLPSDRKVVDSSFDIGLVITVEDRSVLASYVEHPIHKRILEQTLKPLLDHYVVYDLDAATRAPVHLE